MYNLGEITYRKWLNPEGPNPYREAPYIRGLVKETYLTEVGLLISTGKFSLHWDFETMVFNGDVGIAEYSSKYKWTSKVLHYRLVKLINKVIKMEYRLLPLYINNENPIIRAGSRNRLKND